MKVGLVLSGGIAKGAYQIGALKAITDSLGNDYFNCISASSIGAVVDNIPTYPLLEKNEDLVVACYFDRTDVFFENADFNSKVYRLNFMDSGLLKDSFTFEEKTLREMVSVGYETALKMIDELELKKDDARFSQEKVREKYSNLKCSEKHITGDTIVRGLNRINTKLARKRKINDITEGEK